MIDDATPPPEENPATTELIAYLDGELDGDAAQKVEEKLAFDSKARSEAAALKKSFDFLDYLPKPEPKPDFATRTLTKLQPVVNGTAPATPSAVPSAVGNTTAAYVGSGSQIVVVPQRSIGPWVGAWLVIAIVAAVGTYFAHAGLRPVLEPPPNEELALSDLRVIESLPLYLGVDDLEFLKNLEDSELFPTESTLPIPVKSEPVGNSRERLIDQFKAFPANRKQQLRILDQQLNELPATDREHLYRTMENYAVWLERLSDANRHDVLSAPNGAARLDSIRQVREKLWREALPERTREKFKLIAGDVERVGFASQLKTTERTRLEEWHVARRQWDELVGTDKKPWPFADATLASQVDDYVKKVLRVDMNAKFELKGDLPLSIRVTREELSELRFRHDAAVRDGHWFLYGLIVYRLAERHPSLPEFNDKTPITDISHLSNQSFVKEITRKGGLPAVDKRQSRGKWPEFALEVSEAARKTGVSLPEPLGPSKPEEFSPAVQNFHASALLPKLALAEKESLAKLQGKWPEYPRQMIALARKYDLSVPGVTLPGNPSLWAKYYAITPAGKE